MVPKPKIVPRLVIIEGKDKGKVIPLSNGTAVIGRTKGDVLVQDSRLSRSHIAIHYDASTQKLTFTDLKSLNKTVLNGETVETGELKDGDKLLLGNTLFDCQIGAPLDEETSVSKVRESLQREKSERQARELSLSNSGRVEPELAPAAEKIELPEVDDLSGELSEATPKPVVKLPSRGKKTVPVADPVLDDVAEPVAERPRARATMSGLSLGRKFASKARTAFFALLLIGGAAYFLQGGLPSAKQEGDVAFETSAAPVRKLLSQGKVDEALKKAMELQEKFATLADSHMLVGNVLALQRKGPEAIAAYLKAKELAPGDALVHSNLVRLYIKGQQMDAAHAEMAELSKLITDGEHSKTLFVEVAQLLIEFHAELKEPSENAMILAKGLQTKVAPESSIGFKLEAQIHDQEGRKPEALAAVDQGLVVEPNDIWLLERAAILRLELRDLAGATSTVEKWIERHPAANKPLLIMAYLKFQGADPNGAIRYLQQILQAANNSMAVPEAREAVYLLGQIAFNQKQFKEAMELYRQACQAGFNPACAQEAAARKVLDGGPAPETGAEVAPPQAATGEDPRPPAQEQAPPPAAGVPPVIFSQ